MSKEIKNDILYGFLIILFVAIFLESIVTVDMHFKPNFLLISAILLGLFIRNWWVLISFAVLQAILTKYSPFISYELIFIFFTSVLSYFIYKKFFFRNGGLCLSILVLFFGIFFWILFGHIIMSGTAFLMETFYNVILSVIIFELLIWLRKKSF